MDSTPFPVSLIDVTHYRQKAGRNPQPFVVLPHCECVEVMVSGHAWVRDGEKWHELWPGDIVWHSPGDESIGRSDFKNPYHTFVVRFRVRRAKGMGVRRFSKWPDVEEIKLLTNEASRLSWDESFNRNVLRDYLFSRLIYQVHLYEHSLQMSRYPAPIATVIRRIDSDFAKPLLMADLAKESGWSVTHLHVEFQRHLKITPHQMLIQKRLQAAKTRLVSSNDPLKKIAADCGFTSLVSFSHAFKVQTGQTPGIFRDAYRR